MNSPATYGFSATGTQEFQGWPPGASSPNAEHKPVSRDAARVPREVFALISSLPKIISFGKSSCTLGNSALW